MNYRRAVLTMFLLPAAAAAQSPSASLGWWTTTGGKDGNAAAHGLRLAGALGTSLAGREVRVEGAFSQATFRRAFINGESRVNENSLEFAPLLYLTRGAARGATRGATWSPFAGPMISVGIGCGTAGTNDPNGRVACYNNGSRSEGTVRLGAAAGVTAAHPMGSALFVADLRLQANTLATTRGSGPAIVISLGIRLP